MAFVTCNFLLLLKFNSSLLFTFRLKSHCCCTLMESGICLLHACCDINRQSNRKTGFLMTQFLCIVWPSDDTSNRQLSDIFPLWSHQLDPVGSEDNIYSCQAEILKRHLIASTMMMRICVKSFKLKNESMAPFYHLWSFPGLQRQKKNKQRTGGLTG